MGIISDITRNPIREETRQFMSSKYKEYWFEDRDGTFAVEATNMKDAIKKARKKSGQHNVRHVETFSWRR